MASCPWNSSRFWNEKERIFRKPARRGHYDPREAWGDIWEKLRDVFPDGWEGDGSAQDVDGLILRFAYKYFNNERRRCFRRARRMRSLNEGAHGLDEPCTKGDDIEAFRKRDEVKHVVERVLERRSPDDRELLQMKFGIGRKKLTTREIASQRRVTPQAISKRLRNIFRQARWEIEHASR